MSTVEVELKSSNVQEESFQEESFSEESNGINSALVQKLCGIPIVSDSIITVKSYKLGQMTFDLADAGARKVSDLAKPYKFSDHIGKADKIAAESVERLSQTFPLVKEPTNKIFNTVSGAIEDNITAPGSRLAMRFDSQLTPLVNIIEELLQKMIPDENGKTGDRDIQDDQQQILQTLRVLNIALATRDRCVEKVKRQLSTTHTYTADQLRQLQDSSQLLSRATESVNTLNQTLLGAIVNLRDTVQNPDLTASLQTRLQNIAAVIFKDEENLPKAVQARIIELSTALLAVTDSISAYIKLNAKNFPEYLQDRLRPLVTFFEEHYGDVANEIKNGRGTPLEKSRTILQLTTNQTLPLLRSSLSDLQEAVQCYANSLNNSFHNPLSSVSQGLNVK